MICFSSRHYPHVEITKGIELTLEDEPGHKADIEHYIKTKLRLRKSQAAESLQTEILEKSSLIFLWVVLVVEILNSEYPGKPIKRMHQRLKDIPPGLAALFELILSRDEENQALLRLCLQWILFAMRPLKPQELYCAVQFGLKEEESYSGRWDPSILDSEALEAFVRHSSKGFAEITRNNSSEVQFIHESVREFLLGEYEKNWSGIQSGNFVGQSHEVLRDCCLSQLVCRDEQIPSLSAMLSTKTWPDVQSNFPFLDYSSRYILYHMLCALYHGMDQAPFLACFPFPRWEEVSIFLRHHPFCSSAACLSARGKLGSKRYMIERFPPRILLCSDDLASFLGADTHPMRYQVQMKIWGPCLCRGMDERSFICLILMNPGHHIARFCSLGSDIQEPPQLDLTPQSRWEGHGSVMGTVSEKEAAAELIDGKAAAD